MLLYKYPMDCWHAAVQVCGNRIVDGFGFAIKKGVFISYVVVFFTLQLPTEVVSPVVQRCEQLQADELYFQQETTKKDVQKHNITPVSANGFPLPALLPSPPVPQTCTS